jgi:hypothetical protein
LIFFPYAPNLEFGNESSLTLATFVCFCKFFTKGLKSEGERLKVKLWSWEIVKNWQGSAQLSPLSPSPQPSEFCNDENNSVIRSAMDALKNAKKLSS